MKKTTKDDLARSEVTAALPSDVHASGVRERCGHYPGPWYVGERSAGHGIDIRAESSRTLIAQVSCGLMANESNASLIAAAPMMLDALEAAEDWLRLTLSPCDPECECVLHTVQAAIAKAEGR